MVIQENMYENYIDVRLVTDYTVDEFIAGIAHQSGSDSTETFEGDISFANATYYAYGCEEKYQIHLLSLLMHSKVKMVLM